MMNHTLRRSILCGTFFALLLALCGTQKTTAQPELTPALAAVLPSLVKLSDSTSPPNLASSYRVDFALPDAPAFSLLDENPSDILRPSSVKEFAVALSSFIDTATGGVNIPQAFAVEFSPGLLIGGNTLSLSSYQKNPWLYRLRLSAGTRRLGGASAPSEIAVGIRTSFIDKSDLRTNTALLSTVTGITDKIVAIAAADLNRPPTGSGAEVVTLTPQAQAQVDSLNTLLQGAINDAQTAAAQQWNAPAFDFALAALFSSRDSAVSGLQTSEVSGWLTYAKGFGTWGQLLLGGKAGMARGTLLDTSTIDTTAATGKLDFTASLSGRLYIGVNAYKVFFETAWNTTKATSTNTLLINGGGEAMLRSGIWVAFGGGVERDLDAGVWHVISKFSVQLGLPFLN